MLQLMVEQAAQREQLIVGAGSIEGVVDGVGRQYKGDQLIVGTGGTEGAVDGGDRQYRSSS